MPFDDTALQEEIGRMREINGGSLPVMYLDEEDDIPCFIDGKYSAVRVTDAESAIRSLKDIAFIMEIDWDTTSFASVSTQAYKNRVHYRLQQYYKGMEVCGKQLVVTTDSEGNITALSGDFDPIFEDDMDLLVDVSDAAVTASEAVEGVVREGTLVWYSLDAGYDEPAWYFEGNGQCVYVSGIYGDVLRKSMLAAASKQTNVTADGTYFTEYNEDTKGYRLQDTLRNIEVLDCGKLGTDDEGIVAASPLTEKENNDWTPFESRLMINAGKTYDAMLSLLGLYGFDNRGSCMRIAYNIDYSDQRDNNAFAKYLHLYSEGEQTPMGMILVGKNYVNAKRLDVISHEYSHVMEAAIIGDSGLWTSGNAGIIKEGYADAFSELIDCWYGDKEWNHGSRNIAALVMEANGSSARMPATYDEICESDSGNVHLNSSILSHGIVYTLYTNAENQYDAAFSDEKNMMEFLYRSLHYLPEDADFYDCRYAMIQAASDMGLSRESVAQVFDKTGIYAKGFVISKGSVEYTIELVDSITGQSIDCAEIKVSQLFNNFSGTTDATGKVQFQLYNRKAVIIIDIKGYKNQKLKLKPEEPYTQICALVPMKNYVDTKIEEKICIYDAQTASKISDAEVRLRSGANSTCGRYVMDENNKALTFCSDENGAVSLDALEYGIYTMEIKKEGYITAFEELVVSKSQNVSWNDNKIYLTRRMDSDEYRIVLTWDALPQDLDAHLNAFSENGVGYSVYFRNRQYNNEASLDHDVTTGYGPETITLKANKDNKYYYDVVWYRGSGTWNTSRARVQVYRGNQKIADIHADEEIIGANYIWHVFEIDKGNFRILGLE